MKKILLLASLLCSISAAYAQEDATTAAPLAVKQLASESVTNLRVGFVDFRRIMSTAPQLQSIQSQIDGEFKQQNDELKKAQKELLELENKANEVTDDGDYNELEQKLIAKRRAVSKKETAFRDNYSVRRNEEITKLQRQVLDKILEVAKDENYDVILNDTGVIYVSPKADLTSVVIQKLYSESTNKNGSSTSDEK